MVAVGLGWTLGPLSRLPTKELVPIVVACAVRGSQ